MARKPKAPDLNYGWIEEAFRRFPELAGEIGADGNYPRVTPIGASKTVPSGSIGARKFPNPFPLWIELQSLFEMAWGKTPPDIDLIGRVYEFAKWCIAQPSGTTAEDDLGTAVVVCFYEHIPTIPRALADMPNRFTRAQVLGSREAFSHIVGEAGFAKILAAYDAHRPRVQVKQGKRRR
jgi:hypothetical protein